LTAGDVGAAFLDGEDADATASLAIGSFAVFDGPAPSYDEFVEVIAGRLPLVTGCPAAGIRSSVERNDQPPFAGGEGGG
jgi:hypothetical protein